jgi:hypothetical protein
MTLPNSFKRCAGAHRLISWPNSPLRELPDDPSLAIKEPARLKDDRLAHEFVFRAASLESKKFLRLTALLLDLSQRCVECGRAARSGTGQ